jgi:Ca-activated chloride channel family protein
MHIKTQLDLDVIAVERDDQVSLLVELTAPTPEPATERSPRTLVVVLDRSGSMAGGRLDGAKAALTALVDRLDPADRFGLITFDDEVKVEIAATPMTDKHGAKERIAGVQPRGITNLSAGYLRGLQEANRAKTAAEAAVLLISDGHANAGITDGDQLAGVAAKAQQAGVTTSTLGFGLGYDETLMRAIAAGGTGSELFAEHADDAMAAIAGEIDGLLTQSVQAASVFIRMTPACKQLLVVNDMPTVVTTEGVLVELGSFYAGETRRLVVTFDVPAVAALGLTEIASLDFGWVELPALVQHSVTVPVHVNVLPGDQAAGRIPDPTVRSELAYLHTQRAKRAAAEHMSGGNAAAALGELARARDLASGELQAAPAMMRMELHDDIATIDLLAAEVAHGRMTRAAKVASADTTLKSRRRGSARRS